MFPIAEGQYINYEITNCIRRRIGVLILEHSPYQERRSLNFNNQSLTYEYMGIITYTVNTEYKPRPGNNWT